MDKTFHALKIKMSKEVLIQQINSYENIALILKCTDYYEIVISILFLQ